MANRLIQETSPYLLQHAENPVDWYPWGEEALQRAREEDKPILLSIGYSACHWCHVMERESFEDPEIARLMNENLVCIKVDREERPDLDAIYMQAVQAMTGQGGWPLTVFLTPDGKPFYGGTYFPPEDRQGMPGFPRVLMVVADTYRKKREEIVESAEQMVTQLRQALTHPTVAEPLTTDILHQAYRGLAAERDGENGGFGAAPKFPQPMLYEFLLRYHHRTGDVAALGMVEKTLEKMARGGIYDQVGGGFHRYATDARWLVPHFEKMLYDNALLSSLYLHAYQATRRPLYRRIAQETLDYVLREMTSPQSGFYSSQDADSEGVEGKFYVWTLEELLDILGPDEGALVMSYFGVTKSGNFESASILYVPENAESLAEEVGMSKNQLANLIQRAKGRLLEARERRVRPCRDEKIITAWNGLMLRSFAEAACTLGRDDYLQAAIANASFLLEALRQDGRLLHTYKDGQAKLLGYLDDYAFLIDGLLALHEATLDLRWLEEAESLVDAMLDLFWEEPEGDFYDTGRDHEALVVRPRNIFDNALPCGSSAATSVLLRLGVIAGDPEYSRRAATVLRSRREFMARYPGSFGHWLCALDFYLTTPKEIAIVGQRNDPGTQALLETIYRRYLPNSVLTGYEPGHERAAERFALLKERFMLDNRPTAYVCQNYVCQMPVTEPEAMAHQLEG